jgi:uncharacterized protein YqeY
VSLVERLQRDVQQAMLARDERTRDTLRMVIAAVKRQELEAGREVTDELVLSALQAAAKTRQESIEQFERAGREDLAARERAELEVVRRYLPRQLSEDETRALVQRLIAELGLTSRKDVGTLMKAVMARHKGEVDGKAVQRVAAELLGG